MEISPLFLDDYVDVKLSLCVFYFLGVTDVQFSHLAPSVSLFWLSISVSKSSSFFISVFLFIN